MPVVFMLALYFTIGSEATFLSESIVKLLRLPRKNTNITVSGLGVNCFENVVHSVPIVVKFTRPCTTPLQIKAFALTKITAYVRAEFPMFEISENLLNHEHVHPNPWKTDRIDLLIGADLYAQI